MLDEHHRISGRTETRVRADLSEHGASLFRLPQPIDRRVADLRHGASPLRHDDDVEIDEAMSFALVVRRHFRMRRKRFTGVREAAVANRACRVYPCREL